MYDDAIIQKNNNNNNWCPPKLKLACVTFTYYSNIYF